MPFRTFAQVAGYLARFTDYERMTGGRYSGQPYDLLRMARLLEAIGHPERGFPSVHIAGTKGKGSTAHFSEAIFRAHGVRTGLYTSPHLVHMLERIRLDGEPVSEALFVRTMNRMRRAMDRLRPTYFEIMTAAAFLIFAERRVGMAVVEVGLGGRLDATNLIRPSACGIARIDYDHMDRLGSTIAAIASEKAGILKPGVSAFTTETRPAALSVIRRKAREVRAPLQEVVPPEVRNSAFKWEGRRYSLSTLGAFQAENAMLALSMARRALKDALRLPSGRALVTFDPAKAARGLATARPPGRLEIVGHRPTWIVDVAHNPFAARASAAALRAIPARRTICIFGASRDKDWRAMMKALAPQVDFWICTRADNPRAADPSELARKASVGVTSANIASAMDLATLLARPDDRVLVTGSFYVAGEALAALRMGMTSGRSSR
ncbi:MAG TPA: folylpolyglutamate synthase/dihydrofolate synthase family protein [Planctomycetota bacterium]|nr:folylpolyglutamate synthase/dihydrofolate synthase family protein [Planctomycetota bacterium]